MKIAVCDRQAGSTDCRRAYAFCEGGKQETESIPEKEEIRPSGYIKDEILQYFKLSETELESWNKIEKIREYDPEPRVATYTFNSQDGKVNDNTQLFENSNLEVRAC